MLFLGHMSPVNNISLEKLKVGYSQEPNLKDPLNTFRGFYLFMGFECFRFEYVTQMKLQGIKLRIFGTLKAADLRSVKQTHDLGQQTTQAQDVGPRPLIPVLFFICLHVIILLISHNPLVVIHQEWPFSSLVSPLYIIVRSEHTNSNAIVRLSQSVGIALDLTNC